MRSCATQELPSENDLVASDILEDNIRTCMPRILELLLIDRTTSSPTVPRNILWANDNYEEFGALYAAAAQIKPELITGDRGALIMPRALKTVALRKERTRTKAEVFTPTWIVKRQNDAVDKNYENDDLETYTRRKWLEITCGEAPYMATRYDMETGAIIPLAERVGFVDRKLARIHREVEERGEWQRLVELAYKASYGFEWNGDSLLLARENLLYTCRDYHFAKWGELPEVSFFEEIARIISYNVFQMDGLTYTIPLSQKRERVQSAQGTLDWYNAENLEWKTLPGQRVKVMNWDTNKMEFFDKGIR
ncbi:MAG: restriction endonuclease [Planctomycetia bacterium]|nr:restriction endonuclease [Planctomycetia bacterium]